MSLHDTKNFKPSEFQCKCCGQNKVSQVLIDMCQMIRDKVNMPIRINSGYRCPKHNAEVGGVKNSYHAQGLAADLSCGGNEEIIWQAVNDLYKNNQEFHNNLGYAIRYCKRHFVHIDIGAKRASGNVFEIRKAG